MPRRPRVERPDAIHHVMSRGNRRAAIVHDDRDRRLFLSEFERAVRRYEWRSLGYCLLDNHFHLVIETPEPNLGNGMRSFLGRFAQMTNRRHGVDGHAFKERFKSVVVTGEEHLACLLRYVALNPVSAGLCRDPADWPWSSHARLLSGRRGALVDVDRVESLLGAWGVPRGERYASLLAPDGCFGSWDGATEPLPPRPQLPELFASLPHDEAMRRARWRHGYRVREIARFLQISEATVSRRTRTS